MKRRRYYQFQQVTAPIGGGATFGPQPVPPPVAASPSPFMAAMGVSGSIVLVGGVFSLAYGFSYSNVLSVATVPWMIYGAGKTIYLIVLLITDIAMLFEPSEPKQKSTLLPIAKED